MELNAEELIARFSKEIGELTSRAILAETQLAQAQKTVEDLQQQIADTSSDKETPQED